MRKQLIFSVLLMFSFLSCFSQEGNTEKMIAGRSVFLKSGNINSAYPVSGFPGLFYKQYHPIVEAGYDFDFKQRSSSTLNASFSASYFYHRFMQHGIPIMTQLSWKYTGFVLTPYAGLAAGYMLAIPVNGRYTLNDNGEYEKVKGIGRHQAMFGAVFGGEYKLAGLTFLLEHKMVFQTPFVKSYVPLLPYNVIQIGMKYHLN